MKTLSFAFFISLSVSCFAQENLANRKLIVHGEYGFSGANYFSMPDEYWYSKVPGFSEPSDSLGFDRSNSSNYGIFINSIVKLSVEKELKVSFLNQKNITSTLGIVMGIGSQNHSGLNFYKNTREIIDTLTSSQTGQNFYVFENKSEFRSASYFSNSAFFGLKSMNRTNLNRRISFGLGFELAYGFSYDNRIIYNVGESSYLENSLPEMNTQSDYSSTVFEGPFLQSVLFNFPLEIAFRIQKKTGGIFENSAITLNVAPSLNWTFVEKTQSFNGVIGYGIGFRQVF
ncbi:MAG: hypothetical protein ACK46Y_12095 [Fluviicola sp.]|jgi:hypothetical protein